MALGFRQRLAERGLQVTQDMQVIGYDNILKRFGLGLHMTTVEQSVTDLAEACWQMLSVRIDATIGRAGAKDGNDSDSVSTEDGGERPWLRHPRVRLLTPQLVQAACA